MSFKTKYPCTMNMLRKRFVDYDRKQVENQMEYEIDIERLRSDLEDYYGSAMFSGFSMSMMDFDEVESVSDEEIIELAEESGIDLRKYLI